MILKILHVVPWLRRNYLNKWGPKWVHRKCDTFLPLLEKNDTILDVGSGGGLVMQHLRNSGFEVTGLDISDLSYAPETKPIVYDGVKMPFQDNAFDVALLLTVLHHTPVPETVLKETARVAKKVIIIEDIYSNKIQQYLTYWMDGFINWKFSPCPRTNKTDEGWMNTFSALQLTTKTAVYKKILIFFQQATYFIDTR